MTSSIPTNRPGGALGEPFIKNRRGAALKFMRAYLQGCGSRNDARRRTPAGLSGPEVISIPTKHSSIKDAEPTAPSRRWRRSRRRREHREPHQGGQFFRDTGQLDGKVTPADIDRSLRTKSWPRSGLIPGRVGKGVSSPPTRSFIRAHCAGARRQEAPLPNLYRKPSPTRPPHHHR
jgi:hypothetical protein